MIRLQVLDDTDGALLETDEDLISIGRAQGNRLVLEAQHISADHATIAFVGDGWVLRDLRSTNGTRIRRGAETIVLDEAAGFEIALESGDEIEFGELECAVRVLVSILDEDGDEASIVSMRAVSQLEKVEEQLVADRELLRKLYAAQKAISVPIELDAVLDAVAGQVFAFLGRATHVTVALREQDETGRSS
ncbi:MAG: FHA domain-containing protein, partial [Myxococcales bacterium]|nr:FHA domain-containing protein [Myxococcales bacterium]